MPAHAIDTARISFGLVTIPVKLYSTNQPSKELHFHLVHAGCGERVKQQYVCPEHGPVERDDMVKGYELSKGHVVELTKEELEALEAVASDDIALAEFVPRATVDPLLVDSSYYVTPDKGGERAYRLFRDALADSGLAGIASYSARGKQYVVMLRPFEEGLVMHVLRYPDEVKPWSAIPHPKLPAPPRTELELAGRVIASLRHETFDPGGYSDEVKQRVRALIAKKAKGGEISVPEPAEAPAPVTDLMAALKASLGGGGGGNGEAKRPAARKRAARSARHRPHPGRTPEGDPIALARSEARPSHPGPRKSRGTRATARRAHAHVKRARS